MNAFYIYSINSVANGRVVFTYQKNFGDRVYGVLLSLTIDVFGFLYVSVYHGGVVLKIDPQ